MAFGYQTNLPSGESVALSARSTRRKKSIDGTRRIIRMLDRLLLLDAFIIAGYLVAILWDDPDLIDAANMLGPSLMGLGAVYTAYRLLKKEMLVIWTPYFWFLGAIVLYYALGPLAYVFGGDALLYYLQTSLPILMTSADLLRTNLLNSVGIASILFGVRLGWHVYPVVDTSTLSTAADLDRLNLLGIWLLVVGGATQFLLILPWEFGMFDFVLPGVIYNLAKLFLFGIMVIAYVAAKGKRRWKLLLYPLWFVQFLVALIHFSKTEVMISMLLPVLGIYMADRNIKRLLVSFVVMALVYTAIAQMIHYGRQEVIQLSGSIDNATIGQRFRITRNWFEGVAGGDDLSGSELSSAETGWARLSYSNVQAFAMSQYDKGMPGNTIQMAAYVLVPRVIWPDKPIYTNVGIDFYELVTGRRGQTHLGLGIFGEGYWNLGWLGVVLLGVITGIVFWAVGAYSLMWMGSCHMEYMPSIFLGINMGLLGTTGIFANTIVGSGGILLVYALVVSKAFTSVLSSNKKKQP